MQQKPKPTIRLYPLLSSIAAATDLISPILLDHHRKVAFVAASLGQALGVPPPAVQQLAMAGAVHDIGGLSLRSRLDTFEFEVVEPWRHTVPGYVLLSGFGPFRELARLIRYHHLPWGNGRGSEKDGEEVPRLSHLLHLADRITVLIDGRREILDQREEIVRVIGSRSGTMFIPEQVESFRQVSAREAFWFDLTSPEVHRILEARLHLDEMRLDGEQLPAMAELLRKIIDFRSRFTVTHSGGVAAVGAALAKKNGLGEDFAQQLRLAGLLHDIGKLVVPAEILGKQAPLTGADFAVIRKHPYYSAWILRDLEGFGEIVRWTALHHERLDGSGYPFRPPPEELPAAARILAVADTFTALTENRPYRCAMTWDGADKVLRNMAEHRKIDPDYVALAREHSEELNHLRHQAQQAANDDHHRFLADCRLSGYDLEPDFLCPTTAPEPVAR